MDYLQSRVYLTCPRFYGMATTVGLDPLETAKEPYADGACSINPSTPSFLNQVGHLSGLVNCPRCANVHIAHSAGVRLRRKAPGDIVRHGVATGACSLVVVSFRRRYRFFVALHVPAMPSSSCV
uniref:Uncharacterized protein n=1 Tax=Plectus sambesii TaxID=2011161 RepID=A0A914UT41_9BILA